VNASPDPDNISPYAAKREVKKVLFIAITSNRGLAGAFNSSVIKEMNHKFSELGNVEIEILTIGKKAFDSLKKSNKIFDNQSAVYDALNFENVSAVTSNIMGEFKKGNFDKVYLVYNKFINAATQEVVTEQLLPIAMPENQNTGANKDYLFEPNAKEILDNLIPKSIRTQVYKAVLDSVASEHGARMTAMHKATDNAQALKNDLVIFYNKARQAAITNEILEIVGGAEALKNG